MVGKICSASLATSNSFPSQSKKRFPQLAFLPGLYNREQRYDAQQLKIEDKPCHSTRVALKLKGRFLSQRALFATSEDRTTFSEPETDDVEGLNDGYNTKVPASHSIDDLEGTNGKAGFASFYNRPYKREDAILTHLPKRSKKNDLLCLIGPAVLVASFIFPSLYLRKMISAIFEDSLLTDFLILFFTEAIFYCGVAVFLLLINHVRRHNQQDCSKISNKTKGPRLGSRISSVAVLALNLTIPMVTMGLVWPWTGPAASATLAPYLVGIMVQFAFERYARNRNSPSWPVIPIIFQVYRLHQLNRAAQLVTALSLTVRGVEMTPHNLAINGSLSVLLNVLQFLGVVCIWSLSSFLMRFCSSATTTKREA